ncbi:hypothetical protein, partial [Escherichia coli]|uniref:hypothetical protein n=1 Tax=Escherichia coli TaxID=562 RepID=UPI001BB48195
TLSNSSDSDQTVQAVRLRNTIPWLTLYNKNIAPTKENINKGIAIIKTLMPLLKNISIVILAGAVRYRPENSLCRRILMLLS